MTRKMTYRELDKITHRRTATPVTDICATSCAIARWIEAQPTWTATTVALTRDRLYPLLQCLLRRYGFPRKVCASYLTEGFSSMDLINGMGVAHSPQVDGVVIPAGEPEPPQHLASLLDYFSDRWCLSRVNRAIVAFERLSCWVYEREHPRPVVADREIGAHYLIRSEDGHLQGCLHEPTPSGKAVWEADACALIPVAIADCPFCTPRRTPNE
jgi:hypothetical protein